MAEVDDNASIITELLGQSGSGASARGKERGDADASPSTPAEAETICLPLHRMHESRLVSAPGRMVVGWKVPAPIHLAGKAACDGQTMVFSSRSDRGGSLGRGAAMAMACAVALGSTAVLTPAFGPGPERPEGAIQADGRQSVTAADVTGALPAPEPPMQVLAVTQAPVAAIRVASLSPAVVSRPEAPASQGFIRVAQQDSASLNVQNIFGPAGKPLPLSISLNGAKPEDYSFLMFRGLPANMTLSSGFRLKESWAVSLRDIENLSLTAPAGFQGSFNLEVLLIKGRDTPAESRVITVEVVPTDIQLPATARGQSGPGPQILTAAPPSAEQNRGAPTARSGPAQPQQPAAARGGGVPAAEEEAMMTRAQALLRQNDVASARLIFEHLAKRGSAKAALAMGQTFDPAFFRTIEAAGLKPDPQQARDWYSRAADLGDQEAVGRLSSLGTR